ncbi:high mobility group protein 20A-like [Rhopalosiphum maidis]|uniref:high mobility group protein 20A-like n=1 Tax=Rhopalosiphum maidis TaxID=43146 RepID=UPI000EFDCFFD|nr:high mobility group protein 20A-like [Rhopalosiphum maidis]
MSSSENTDSIDKSSGQDDVTFVENVMPKKVNKTKVKKTRPYLRDKSAPKPPASGYIRFISNRRVQFRSENPNLSFAEITKILATEWNQMPADKKQPYLLAAEQDRVKYDEELAAYKKTDSYNNFIKSKLNKKKINTPIQKDKELKKENTSSKNNNAAHDISIFTEEFLEFNKARETELRNLRKNVTTQEQEVCVLDKHNENVQKLTAKLKANTEKLEAGCTKYEEYLKKLRSKLLNAFANFELTDNTESPTYDTIDTYMVNLSKNLTNDTNADSSRITNVKKAISKLNFSQGKTFACQVEYHLYHLGIHITVAHESIQINSKKNPTDDITKIISEMIDAWLMINDTNKWIEGTESVFTVNIQVKRRKVFNDCKVEIDLPIFSNPIEDNDKYEIIKEILNKLKHQNPIYYPMGINNDEFLQLHQKPAKGDPNIEVLQKHNECSIISNATNEEEMPEKVKKVDQECSDSEVKHLDNNSTDSHTTDEEKLPELVQKAVEVCSQIESLQSNVN